MPQLLEEMSAALIEAQSLSILDMRAHKSAIEHGAIRFKLGFDIEEVIAEFGLLREVMQDFAELAAVNISGPVNLTVNRVIDKAIAVSLQTYVQQQTQEAERKRQEYLSFLVHDLKTPISAITTAISIIDEQFDPECRPSKVNDMVDIVRRNATRLNKQVMEIINEENRVQSMIADAPSLKLELRSVDVWPIAERLAQDCQPIADAQGTTIYNKVPSNLRVAADSELLIEIFQNLLSNAIKYTTNGRIVIGGEDSPDSVVVWVSDTGTGIPLDRIQEIFRKGAADPDKAESTGLGLAIVNKAVQLLRGEISVQSEPGVGSSFRIEFPKRGQPNPWSGDKPASC
jgi:signal transduction histidine kinase